MDQVVIERSPRLLLAGFSFFGDPFHSHAGWTEANEIGRLWQRLLAYWQASDRGDPPRVMYEVHIQNSETPRTGEFEVFVGHVVDSPDEVPLELCLKQLPQTDYAVFTLQGSQMQQDEPLVDNWLRANDYRVALPFFIERYDERYQGLERLEESVLEFLVPVVPAGERGGGADGPD